MYTDINFKTKKALKDAVKSGQQIRVYSPGPFPCKRDGYVAIEGPHYPAPHTWYATAICKDGVILRIS